MHKKAEFNNQEVDPDAAYVSCKEVAARSDRSRGSVWLDIKKGKLRAIWGAILINSHCLGKPCSKPNRAWLVHPIDADQYIANHKKTLEDLSTRV